MKTTLVLLTATLLVLATPALSLSHDRRGDGLGDRHARSWEQQRSPCDAPRGHQPPGHWQRQHKRHGGGYGYCRLHQSYGHRHRDRLFLGLPSLVFQVRW
ncbi:MAG TPA: hypothetical protein VK997_02430 [Deferrisomatales bacterium]|nr:hypothetical protein [Deferrisomatales bacterium]